MQLEGDAFATCDPLVVCFFSFYKNRAKITL